MVNVTSRANQFILGQNVYTYMVNVVRRAIIKMFILRCECCEESNYQNVFTYMVNVTREQISSYLDKMFILKVLCRANFILEHGECCVQSKSVHTWAKCLYLYGECCEERNDQNVFTYMVNVVSRAIIKMFILIW